MTPSPQDPQKEKCAGCYKCITRRNVSTGDECASRYHCDCHTIESNVPSEVSQGSEERLSSKIDSPHDLIREILLPCELVPDLEAQVTNQLEDLVATMKSEGAREERERIIERVSRIYRAPDAFDQFAPDREAQGYNEAVEDVLAFIRPVECDEKKNALPK